MSTYTVTLMVEMDGSDPGEAVRLVSEMADGWTYEAVDIETGKGFTVHMDKGEPTVEEGVLGGF